ncbi:peptide-methionine (S)-S-oxide reductase MsrA [Maribrevibacterium harenarium]|uniref:Peptide methionine sulfoxide reductase MsrA n=1 Tax=Maribrevibacterium harenarium TaxID=2589817 RepID=A0A501WRH0_9GAMM|nr:peptide-methionine (S)-S-oxide reductase MsrA [Maribrevibacterium harenarium]TPE50684.1 peptide-methionine (S)-S-oxide reductase MsrA [Maribrevibacterium harenarium]
MFEALQAKLAKCQIPEPAEALPGREIPLTISGIHAVNGDNILRKLTDTEGEIYLGMGCFWGAERKFWNTPGVTITAVGYGGGYTPNPTYEEVCTGKTGHTELVRVVFDNKQTNLEQILKVFWENHDPTQGLRQGNDIGSQYRSAIYWVNDADAAIIQASKDSYQQRLLQGGFGMITTEVDSLKDFYYGEEYHQQYLHKNPNGYCGLGGTGVTCPIGVAI